MTRNSLSAPLVSVRMINRAQECRQRAQHCERARSLAVTLEARLMYFDLAQEWRELADQIELLDRAPDRGGAPEGEQNGNHRMARGPRKLLG
jgi:hypothetical protein